MPETDNNEKSLHPELLQVLAAIRERRVVNYNSPGDYFAVHTADRQQGFYRERGYEILLRITKYCNIRCRHCFITPSARIIPPETITTLIDLLVRDNLPFILFVLSGGEPTLHPDFFQIVRYLVQARMPRIIIQTNAIRFADKKFFTQLPRSRSLEFFVSLPAAEQIVYDTMTCSKAYSRAIKGMARLTSRYSTRLNFVVNRLNYQSLAETASFVRRRFSRLRTTLLISNLGCLDSFDYRQLLVCYTDLLPVLRDVIRRQPEVQITLSGGCSFPLCIYRQLGRPINKHMLYLAGPCQTGYDHTDRQFYKNELCRSCRYTDYCFGFASRYIELFGDEEIRPL